jgi:hypothetical protein
MKVLALAVLLIAVASLSVPAAHASGSTPLVHLKITTYSDSSLTTRTSKVVEGGGLYVVVSLLNGKGFPVLWPSSKQLVISLYVKSGYLTATDVYITKGDWNTSSSFGLILYQAPSSPGPVRLTASATIAGVSHSAAERIMVIPPS